MRKMERKMEVRMDSMEGRMERMERCLEKMLGLLEKGSVDGGGSQVKEEGAPQESDGFMVSISTYMYSS